MSFSNYIFIEKKGQPFRCSATRKIPSFIYTTIYTVIKSYKSVISKLMVQSLFEPQRRCWMRAQNLTKDFSKLIIHTHNRTTLIPTGGQLTKQIHMSSGEWTSENCKFTKECKWLTSESERETSAQVSLACVVCHTREYERCWLYCVC